MQWSDESIVLGVKRHGEANAILELMTPAHGRHLGLVRGGAGSRMKPVLQPGNTVAATWRARLDEHLGHFVVEGIDLRAASFLGSAHAVYGVTHLAALCRLLPERDPHAAVFEALRAWLAEHSPAGPWHYPEDQLSDAPMRSLAAEITREKLFNRLHQELPYQATVETDSWKDLRDGSARVEQTIYVERESQRKIVLGKGGATIRAIGAAARKEIAELTEQKVHLFLFVKVREGWGDDPERYRSMGLEFPNE